MPFNPFTLRDEYILIEYKDVIKCPSAGMLQLIKDEYIEDMKDLIDTRKLQRMDFKNIQRYCIERPFKNILDYIKIIDFNTDDIYNALYNNCNDLYEKLPLMIMGEAVFMLISQKFTKKIYIFSEEYDKKIEDDIIEKFGEHKNIFYVAGSFADILNNIEQPTSYMLSDVDKVKTILKLNKQEYSEIMIAQYGYNYEINDGIIQIRGNYDELMPEKHFKIASFTPLNMDSNYYNME